MYQLSGEHLDQWMKGYKSAWEGRIAEEAVRLFTDNAEYYESPFSEPACGSKSIMDFWQDVPILQTNVSFEYQILFIKEAIGYVHAHGRFMRLASGEEVTMDGIFEVHFAENGRCDLFRQWWHEKTEL
ncbi:MAG: nuclear transport factor 2 family protein [Bacteroidia bacterium]